MRRGVATDRPDAAMQQPELGEDRSDIAFDLVAHHAPGDAALLQPGEQIGHALEEAGVHAHGGFIAGEEIQPQGLVALILRADAKASADEQRKHQNFVDRMVEKGYTPKQVRLLVEWYLRVRKSS